MAAPFSNTQLRVPPGFQNILESLSREVLRHQPEDIYQFGAKHFADLLQRRQETGEDDIALLGAKLEDRYYNNKAFGQGYINDRDPEQQDAAVKIQSEYRRHAAQKEMQNRKEEQAVTAIQASFRGYQDRTRAADTREELEVAQEMEEESYPDETPLEDGESVPAELDEAATKIQAAFKGYVTRKEQEQIQSGRDPEAGETTQSASNIASHHEEPPEDVLVDNGGEENNVAEEIDQAESGVLESQRTMESVDNAPQVENDEEPYEHEAVSESRQEQVLSPASNRSTSAVGDPNQDGELQETEVNDNVEADDAEEAEEAEEGEE